jgi:hypothetical protein
MMINSRLRWASLVLGCGLLLGSLACGAITAEQVKQRIASKIISKLKNLILLKKFCLKK